MIHVDRREEISDNSLDSNFGHGKIDTIL
jgi:hypothetical protein